MTHASKPKKSTKRALRVPLGGARVAKRESTRQHTSASFPVVGIGASAGGLEALELFLRHVPPASGLSIVIVQHLDPSRKGIMPELLQHATDMKVVQVKDGTRVQPDCVYVIPPNKSMSILHGVLHLLDPVEPRGQRLPIDFFFRSLALDRREHSIGVVLSGMGSDGTAGLRSIKEMAGLALVQDPATAKFDGMPGSVVSSGLADIVAPAEALPARILEHLKIPPLLSKVQPQLSLKEQGDLAQAVILLRARTGHDFSLYKRNTLCRRIERRMALHRLSKMSAYIRFLQENTQELDLLFKELLIGVTNFFRDTHAWDYLRKIALPALLANRRPGQTLRAWVTGCSTGEEAYSLAIVFKECLEELGKSKDFSLQIFATDLDKDAIEKARQGVFPETISKEVPARKLARYFLKEKRGYQISKEIRETVIFATQNLIMDPPFTRLDILCCRNLLIYLSPEVQKKLLPLFHYNLNPGGLLFLGSAETIGNATELFQPIDEKSRLFRRKETGLPAEPIAFPASFSVPPRTDLGSQVSPKAAPSLQSLADQLVLQHYASPAALVNEQGDILYISGRTGKYLEPAAGKANWNIFAMARDAFRFELHEAFNKVLKSKSPVQCRDLPLSEDPRAACVRILVRRVEEPRPLRGMVLIAFTEVPAPAVSRGLRKTSAHGASSARLLELQRERDEAREELRSAREEMQSSQEELRSTNEELQSTNEELQSTNEELTTSKEEMQSLNEELQTLNAELQSKLDELSRSNNDMKNLLNSTDIATLFLDNSLKVRRYTTQAARIIKLIPGDVGRPVTDLATELQYPELEQEARAVLQSLLAVEKPISARDGRWFSVRIMPYRTLDNRIDGVVITFVDITAAKQLEARYKASEPGGQDRLVEVPTRTKKTGKRGLRKGGIPA